MSPRTSSPSISLSTIKTQQGNSIYIHGKNWPTHEKVTLSIKGIRKLPIVLLSGSSSNDTILPDTNGEFLAELYTTNLKRGKYIISAIAEEMRAPVTSEFAIKKRVEWSDNRPRAEKDKPYYRHRAFELYRNNNDPLNKGTIDTIRKEMLRRNDRNHDGDMGRGVVFFSNPVPGKCNWIPLGPAPAYCQDELLGNTSGRIKSFAIDPLVPTTMYAGAATGGLWKSVDSGKSWVPKTDDQPSLACGSIAINPNNSDVVYVGTGEMVPGNPNGGYFGRGILKSSDGGNTWNVIGDSFFDYAVISRIALDPSDPESIFVSASNGLWTSKDGGKIWSILAIGSFTDLILIRDPSQPEITRIIAGKSEQGLVTLTLKNNKWSEPEEISIPGATKISTNITFGVCRTKPNEIYAALSTQAEIANMLQYIFRSSDWGITWQICNVPKSGIGYTYQANYNLSILPHPEDPETVFLAVVNVFKSTDGGIKWKNISFDGAVQVHGDTRALTFHPELPDSLYIGSDGGVYFSPDAGDHWQALNFDISTIQIYDFGQHPKYDAIIIAGSQDNGGFYYTGSPIWSRHWVKPGVPHDSMQGDGVVAQIDPFNAYIHYYGTGPEAKVWRSDNAGIKFNAEWKNFWITAWQTPFFCSPHEPGVVYTGGFSLKRSTNRGNEWTTITEEWTSNIRALGFHTTNHRELVIGTGLGKIFRITGPVSGDWNLKTVVTEDITFTGLPKNASVSSIALEHEGKIWISLSNVEIAQFPGTLSNHHVFRLDKGASKWIEKSNGLSMANPVNTIICDPKDSSTVYCGADWGVFKWSAGSDLWELFDEGLPNAPVFNLQIHNASRKIRAGTFGRGLWERQLDEIFGPNQFLYMRKHIADAGSEPCTSGVEHPFVEGAQCWHWQSPDIVVDHLLQTPEIVTDPLTLFDKVVHSGAARGNNRIYVKVHNKGPFKVTNVQVRAFFAPASAGLPDFPEGMIKNPFNFVPSADSEWNPAGKAFPIDSIEPGTTRLAFWEFVIPESAPAHSCIMAFTTSSEDSFSEKEGVNPDSLVINNRRVALRNLDLDAIPGTTDLSGETEIGGTKLVPGASWPKIISFNGNTSKKQRCSITITTTKLPEDAYFIVLPEHDAGNIFRSSKVNDTASAEKIKKAFLNSKHHGLDSELYRMNDLIVYPVSNHRELVLGEAMLSKTNSMRMAIWIWSKKWHKDMQYSYDVLQWNGKRIAGGFSVEMVNGEYFRNNNGIR